MKLASSEESDVGKAWMRTQAIEILGLIGVHRARTIKSSICCISILEDKKASLTLRCTAAEALGQINLANAAGLKAAKLIAALTQLMQDGCEAELKSAQRQRRSRLAATHENLLRCGDHGARRLDERRQFPARRCRRKPQITEFQAILKELLHRFG